MNRLFVMLQYLLPHHGLSRLVAVLANSRWSLIKNPFIYLFMKRFKVQLDEARIRDYRQFENFNAFFTRQLRDGARVIEGDSTTLVSPADGAISQSGPIRGRQLLQAKGIDYSLTELLGGLAHDVEPFTDGSFATIYLSPRDYHRVHMPIDGVLRKTVYVPGRLFSVNQQTTERVAGLFSRNERLACFFDTPAGPMALILVGAMIVAGIETVWAGQVSPTRHGELQTDFSNREPLVELTKGAEMGRFKLGSTVILLMGPNVLKIDSKIQPGSPIRLGEKLGTLNALGTP